MAKDTVVPAGKVPPQSLDAEMSMLGAVLIDDDVIADVSSVVTSKDFYDKRHGIIFAAMMRLYERHKPIDLLTLTDELKRKKEFEAVGGSAYLTELTDYVPTAAHATAYAELVSQKAIRRRLIKASADISELGFDEEISTEEILGQAEAELFSVSDQSIKQDLVSLESILGESFERIEDLHRNKGSL
ncbi:MAG TPA: DnaB-like helicase N-terminal domain-containing protein, partial [Candidatus Saccharibacteria bacterium]|nr:DnaB-like helicase N-terminal domain-containing protein [Candidatus Saccharibacteria bacterium]